jgi:beta-glucosidase
MAEATYYFPRHFWWGTATAGFQVEGHSANADWWHWEHQPGRILDEHKSGAACDWWHGRRWQEDFDRAASDGHNALRLSVEWSRIEPSPARWDEDALDYYRQMIMGLRQRGLEPMVTLHHFASPVWVSERRAWETGEIVALFERYVRKVVGLLGEQVRLWCTINEPNVFVYSSFINGAHPPGKKNLRLAFQVAEQALRAHAIAYRVIHAARPDALVGLPIHFRPALTAPAGLLLDEWVAHTQFNLFSSLFPEAIRTGWMRRPFQWSVRVPEAKGTLDYFAMQYYTAEMVRFDVTNPHELFGRRAFPPGTEVDDAGLYASYPPGFFKSLAWAHKFGCGWGGGPTSLPIIITENGIGDAADKMRPRYLLNHLRQLWRAVNMNWNVLGYFHWSLVDNFEWERGWAHRFGLYALDPETQARTPRPSAQLYAEICRAGGVSTDLVTRYAPELIEQLFPG